MARRHLTPLEVAQIVGMVQGGQTQSAVANHFKLPSRQYMKHSRQQLINMTVM